MAAASAALSAFGCGLFYSGAPPILTDKDTIVLADFTNTTGDPVFDGTLRQGLAVQLQQSPFLSLISEERVQKTAPDGPAAGCAADAGACQMCERTASSAVLEGSIASLGSQYVLGLRAKDCRTGDVLDEEQVQAARKEDVLNALSQVASRFRTRVGESLATVEQHDTPLEEATTPSLEALKAYSAASKIQTSIGLAGAVPLFKRAIEIDPKFAMAHASLGFTYGLMGEPALSAESNRRAYALRDRVSDRGEFFITASYELQVTGNLEKARRPASCGGARILATSCRTAPGGVVVPDSANTNRGSRPPRKRSSSIRISRSATCSWPSTVSFSGGLHEAEDALRRAAARKLEIPELRSSATTSPS